jgi:hypothetical protein
MDSIKMYFCHKFGFHFATYPCIFQNTQTIEIFDCILTTLKNQHPTYIPTTYMASFLGATIGT